MTEVVQETAAPVSNGAPEEEAPAPQEVVIETPSRPAGHVVPPEPEPEKKEDEKKPDEPKVLDLTSLAPDRRLVKLPTAEHPEGENFEIRLLDDFGIAMQQKLLSWSRTYERLFNSEDELDDDQQARLKFVLDSLFDVVLDAPKAVKETMSDGLRSRVMTAFSLAPLIAQQERAQREEEEKQEQEEKRSISEK